MAQTITIQGLDSLPGLQNILESYERSNDLKKLTADYTFTLTSEVSANELVDIYVLESDTPGQLSTVAGAPRQKLLGSLTLNGTSTVTKKLTYAVTAPYWKFYIVNNSLKALTSAQVTVTYSGIGLPNFTSSNAPTAQEYGVGQLWVNGQQYWSDGTNLINLSYGINLAKYVKDFTGTADETAAFNAAQQEAINQKTFLYHPGGIISVANILLEVPLIGAPMKLLNLSEGQAAIKGRLDDGSPVIEIASTYSGFLIENIRIYGKGAVSDGTLRSMVGLKLGTVGGSPETTTALRGGQLNNVYVSSFELGIETQGWSNDWDNVWINNCNLGTRMEFINNCSYGVKFTGCKQDYVITKSHGLTFPKLYTESSIGSIASTIDDCDGINIASYYAEASNDRGDYFLKVGTNAPVYNLSISGSRFSAAGPKYQDVILLDNVDNITLDIRCQTGSDRGGIALTNNAKNIYGLEKCKPNFSYLVDNRPQPVDLLQTVSANGLARYSSRLLLGGNPSRVVLSEEQSSLNNTNVLKVSCVDATAYNYIIDRYLSATVDLSPIYGKTVTLIAQVYVPDLPSYRGTLNAQLRVEAKNAGTSVLNVYSGAGYLETPGWHIVEIDLVMSAILDQIDVYFYANNSANKATSSDYVLVGGYAFVDKLAKDKQLVFQSSTTPTRPATFFNTASNGILDNLQSYNVGDKILVANPAAASPYEYVCTSSPNTFKTISLSA